MTNPDYTLNKNPYLSLVKYSPSIEYEATQLNPGKGLSYKESDSSSYDKMQPKETKSDYTKN